MNRIAPPTDVGVQRGAQFVSTPNLVLRTRRVASGLAAAGVGEGDTVAALLRNDIPLFELSFAAAMLGASTVPINWHGKAREVGHVVSDCNARVFVGHADLLRGVAEIALDPSRLVIWVPTPDDVGDAHAVDPSDREVPAGATGWAAWRDRFEPMDRLDSLPSPMTTMVYTSGTTGNPKGVRRVNGKEPRFSEETRQEMLRAPFMAESLHRGMRTVVTGPMYHSAPNAAALLTVWLDGFVVLQPRFDAEQLLALVERHRITHLSLVPTMFVRLLRLPRETRQRHDLSSLRFVSHTAAPCSPTIKRQMIDWLGPIIWESYGATETGSVTACDSHEWLAHPGTVGRPLPGATVRIVDDEGHRLGPGTVGEIYARHLLTGDFTYEGNSEARSEIERDGLVTCGDVGYFDEDGYLYLSDRKRDMVISGGVNIYPIEIEACLLACEGILDCAVFGIPDDEFGESLCAAVAVEPGAALTAEDVQAHVRRHLSGFKVPKIVTFIEEFPRDDNGKVAKHALRQAQQASRT